MENHQIPLRRPVISVLEIDDEQLSAMSTEQGGGLALSAELRLLARRNKIEVLVLDVRRDLSSGNNRVTNVGFQVCALPHESCVFRSASLTVDLKHSPNAAIRDFRPARMGAQVVQHAEKFNVPIKVGLPLLTLELGPIGEASKSYEIVTPEVIGLLFGNRTGVRWTFHTPTAQHELRLDHLLGITAEHVPSEAGLLASVVVRATVAFRGFAGVIPLIGRRTASEEGVVRLDR